MVTFAVMFLLLVKTTASDTEGDTKCESSLHQSPSLPLLEQLYQPSALINACLCDTVLKLSLSPPSLAEMHAYVYLAVSLLTYFLPQVLH